MTTERILAFGCHPDDIEFMAAGTLALLARDGFEIHLACMTGGEGGSPNEAPQVIRARRLKEAEASAKLLGAHFHYAGGYDLEVEYSSIYRQRTTRIVREVDPWIILTCPPMDYIVDHEETSKLVRTAAYIASVPNYDCGYPTQPTHRFPYVYYWNAVTLKDIFGRPLPIACRVDISPVIETKEAMLSQHASQRDWLKHHNGYDQYLDCMRTWSRDEGAIIGVPYAEGFIQHLSQGHPQDNILKTLLGDRCHLVV